MKSFKNKHLKGLLTGICLITSLSFISNNSAIAMEYSNTNVININNKHIWEKEFSTRSVEEFAKSRGINFDESNYTSDLSKVINEVEYNVDGVYKNDYLKQILAPDHTKLFVTKNAIATMLYQTLINGKEISFDAGAKDMLYAVAGLNCDWSKKATINKERFDRGLSYIRGFMFYHMNLNVIQKTDGWSVNTNFERTYEKLIKFLQCKFEKLIDIDGGEEGGVTLVSKSNRTPFIYLSPKEGENFTTTLLEPRIMDYFGINQGDGIKTWDQNKIDKTKIKRELLNFQNGVDKAVRCFCNDHNIEVPKKQELLKPSDLLILVEKKAKNKDGKEGDYEKLVADFESFSKNIEEIASETLMKTSGDVHLFDPNQKGIFDHETFLYQMCLASSREFFGGYTNMKDRKSIYRDNAVLFSDIKSESIDGKNDRNLYIEDVQQPFSSEITTSLSPNDGFYTELLQKGFKNILGKRVKEAKDKTVPNVHKIDKKIQERLIAVRKNLQHISNNSDSAVSPIDFVDEEETQCLIKKEKAFYKFYKEVIGGLSEIIGRPTDKMKVGYVPDDFIFGSKEKNMKREILGIDITKPLLKTYLEQIKKYYDVPDDVLEEMTKCIAREFSSLHVNTNNAVPIFFDILRDILDTKAPDWVTIDGQEVDTVIINDIINEKILESTIEMMRSDLSRTITDIDGNIQMKDESDWITVSDGRIYVSAIKGIDTVSKILTTRELNLFYKNVTNLLVIKIKKCTDPDLEKMFLKLQRELNNIKKGNSEKENNLLSKIFNIISQTQNELSKQESSLRTKTGYLEKIKALENNVSLIKETIQYLNKIKNLTNSKEYSSEQNEVLKNDVNSLESRLIHLQSLVGFILENKPWQNDDQLVPEIDPNIEAAFTLIKDFSNSKDLYHHFVTVIGNPNIFIQPGSSLNVPSPHTKGGMNGNIFVRLRDRFDDPEYNEYENAEYYWRR